MAQFQQNIYCLLSIVVENIKFLTDFLDDFLPDRVDIQSWSRSTRLDQDGDDQQCPHEPQGGGGWGLHGGWSLDQTIARWKICKSHFMLGIHRVNQASGCCDIRIFPSDPI